MAQPAPLLITLPTFVDELVQPMDVEVIEVFRGLGSIPPEFLTPQARCGVIAIWTKRSSDRAQ